MAVAYSASSLELAVLEALVRLRVERPPLDYWWIELEVPDGAIGSFDRLPRDWDSPSTYRSDVQGVGARWVKRAGSLALRVPAAVLPERQILLVNPSHARFGEIHQVATAPFTWPRRLLSYTESLARRR